MASKRDAWRLVVLGALITVALTAYFATELHRLRPEELAALFRGLGAWAGLVYVLVYAVAPVVLVPASLLTVVAGALFGPFWGTVVVLIGANLGASAAFVSSRYFGSWLQGRLDRVRFLRIDVLNRRIEENGFLLMLFLRLVPLFPFVALNYALGLTRIRTIDYVLGTLVGMIPGTVVYVYLGSSLASLDPLRITVAVLLFAVLIVASMYARRRYGKRLTGQGGEQ